MAMLFLIVAAVLPALILVIFIYRKDKFEKEPIPQLLKGFVFGIFSLFASLLLSIPARSIGLFPVEASTFSEHLTTAFWGAAVPEELAKFFFLWLLLKRNKYFNEYFDGIVYAVCVGMGFAAMENIIYLISYFDQWATVGIGRAFVSIPAHFFLAVAMGYFYSKAKFGKPENRKQNLGLAICLPILLHTAVDSLLMITEILAISGAAFYAFLVLYIFMLSMSKQRIETHLETDAAILKAETTEKTADAENVNDSVEAVLASTSNEKEDNGDLNS